MLIWFLNTVATSGNKKGPQVTDLLVVESCEVHTLFELYSWTCGQANQWDVGIWSLMPQAYNKGSKPEYLSSAQKYACKDTFKNKHPRIHKSVCVCVWGAGDLIEHVSCEIEIRKPWTGWRYLDRQLKRQWANYMGGLSDCSTTKRRRKTKETGGDDAEKMSIKVPVAHYFRMLTFLSLTASLFSLHNLIQLFLDVVGKGIQQCTRCCQSKWTPSVSVCLPLCLICCHSLPLLCSHIASSCVWTLLAQKHNSMI